VKFRNICIGLTLCAGLCLAAAAAEVPEVGQTAPAVVLPSQDGATVDLKSFRGKWVVLYFYPKDMTQGCTIEAHNFQQDLAKYQNLNAAIVGVSVDSTGSFLIDPTGKIVQVWTKVSPMKHSEEVLAALGEKEGK
jgi:peroxiredoxin Q/BCP